MNVFEQIASLNGATAFNNFIRCGGNALEWNAYKDDPTTLRELIKLRADRMLDSLLQQKEGWRLFQGS